MSGVKRTRYFLGKYRELKVWLNYGPVSEDEYGRFLMRLIDAVGRNIILDDGCGNGRFSMAMAREGAQVISLDVNKTMVKTVNEERFREGFADSISPIRGDVQNLPFRDGVFDKVLNVHNLWYVIEFESSVAEMIRVLIDGGEIIADQINSFYPPCLLRKIAGILRLSRGEYNARTAKKFLRPFMNYPMRVFSTAPSFFSESLLRELVIILPLGESIRQLAEGLVEIDFHVMPGLKQFATRFTIRCVKRGSLGKVF